MGHENRMYVFPPRRFITLLEITFCLPVKIPCRGAVAVIPTISSPASFMPHATRILPSTPEGKLTIRRRRGLRLSDYKLPTTLRATRFVLPAPRVRSRSGFCFASGGYAFGHPSAMTARTSILRSRFLGALCSWPLKAATNHQNPHGMRNIHADQRPDCVRAIAKLPLPDQPPCSTMVRKSRSSWRGPPARRDDLPVGLLAGLFRQKRNAARNLLGPSRPV